MESIIHRIKRYIHRVAALSVAIILRPGAVYNVKNFKLWERCGYHILPIDYYSPIPDTRGLEKMNFQPSELTGIDLRPTYQLGLMKEAFARFSHEYRSFPEKANRRRGFCSR